MVSSRTTVWLSVVTLFCARMCHSFGRFARTSSVDPARSKAGQRDYTANRIAKRRHTLASRIFYASQADIDEGNENVEPQLRSIKDNSATTAARQSRILSLTCTNLAGAVADPYGGSIEVSLVPTQSFVACTGETGSGKSLLLARALELLTGARATESMVGGKTLSGTDEVEEQTASVEIKLLIDEPHLSFVRESLSSMDVDISGCKDNVRPQPVTIRRTLMRAASRRTQPPRLVSSQYALSMDKLLHSKPCRP